MKKVLIVTYSFPPHNSIASMRVGCIAKYLLQWGWTPTVVCPEWTVNNCCYDPEVVTDLPPLLDIVRIPYGIRYVGLKMLSAYRRTQCAIANRYSSYIWCRRAMRVVERAVHEGGYDAIFSSAPCAWVHRIAARTSRKWAIPWIADFRDVPDQFLVRKRTDRLLTRCRILLEMRWVKYAQCITTVSDALASILGSRYAQSIHVIPNGFDPDDIADDSITSVVSRQFVISYTGTLLSQRNPEWLFSALEELVQNDEIHADDICVRFYGATPEQLSPQLCGKDYQFTIQWYSRVSARECCRIQQSSTILLMLAHPDEPGIMTGKIFSYLAARRPIISIPSDGGCVDQLLNETGAGVSCRTVDDVKGQLRLWYKEWRDTGTVASNSNMTAIMRYSRREQARELSTLLDGIVRRDGA